MLLMLEFNTVNEPRMTWCSTKDWDRPLIVAWLMVTSTFAPLLDSASRPMKESVEKLYMWTSTR